MDQSKSNKTETEVKDSEVKNIELPARKFTLEFFVGLFTILGLGSTGYLAMGLGGLEIFGSNTYTIIAEFDNISGLKKGASVEIAGVPIGKVTNISLRDPMADVTLNIVNSVRIRDDDIAAIRTKGIIGDRYVKISRGASDDHIPVGGRMVETESVVDIEDIIGKLVHSFSSDKDE